jgi:hypothetical protein
MEERGYAAEFADFIVGEEGNQWLAKPSFTFHNVSASAGFHKEFAADLNWYSNISLQKSNLLFFLALQHIELGYQLQGSSQTIQR